MVRIAIDSGHGLYTSGKEVPSYMGYGKIKEWELNDKITREIIRLLNQYENVEILRTDDPTGKRDVPRIERCKKANEFKADIFISNHHNAGIRGGKGGGLVVFRYINSKMFTKAMQKALYESILEQTGLKGNRSTPLAEAKFDVLRYTNMPAVLIEHGFMDSPSDMKVIMKPDFATKSAQGIVNWLEKHFKLKKKAIPKAQPKSTAPTGLHRVRKSWEDAKSQIGAYAILDNAKKVADQNKGYKVFDENGKVLYPVESEKVETKNNFPVKVTANALNIRSGPGTNYKKVGVIKDKGVYTIVETKGSWGKLKSGAGWISLNYTKKI